MTDSMPGSRTRTHHYPQVPKLHVTLVMAAERAAEIETNTRQLGLSRHALMHRALEIGMPLAVAQATCQAAAQQQQQG